MELEITAAVLGRKERSTMATGSGHIDENVVELRLEPWAHSGEAKLYVTPEHEEQLRELLTAEGIANSRSTELHEGPILAILLISVANPAAWKALATVLTAFLERNKHKTIKTSLGGEPVELSGYSEREVKRLTDRMAQLHQEQQQQELTSHGDQPTGEVEPEA
jgi:hypothetical protein